MCCHLILHLYLDYLQREKRLFTCCFVHLGCLLGVKIWQLSLTVSTNIFDFMKINDQNHIKMLRKLHNIYINLGTLFGVLSFNITSVFRLFAKGKMFVYMSPWSQKFDNSRTSSIYFSSIDKNNYSMLGRKGMVQGNQHMLRNLPVTCCTHAGSEQTDTHTLIWEL